jgi:hypothetical protein
LLLPGVSVIILKVACSFEDRQGFLMSEVRDEEEGDLNLGKGAIVCLEEER